MNALWRRLRARRSARIAWLQFGGPPALRRPWRAEVSRFVFPASRALGPPEVGATHDLGWQSLQAGDLKAAERNFTAALRLSPGFYPSEAGLGYLALARKDNKEAAEHFDRVLAANAGYAPALAGRGEALLTLGQREQALASFEAAIAADPRLATLRSRIEVLRFRGLQDDVDAARRAADAGRLAEARAMYERTIAASPDSPFLYRELANVEKREGNLEKALEHVQKAAAMNPAEPRNFVTMAEIYEAQADYPKAIDGYLAASALEPSDAIDARIEALREKAAFAGMPEDYKAIEASPTVTRAQLARVRSSPAAPQEPPRPDAVVITDMRATGRLRGSWPSRGRVSWRSIRITRFNNAIVRRDDLAQAASKALALLAASAPRLPRRSGTRAAVFRMSRRTPQLPAASVAVESACDGDR